jgi:hypothetical protein
MDDFETDFPDLFPGSSAPQPLDSTTPASSSGFSLSGLLSGITSLGTAGINAYKGVTAPTAAQTAAAKAKATAASYMPLILLGGGILIVVVIIFALLRRGK